MISAPGASSPGPTAAIRPSTTCTSVSRRTTGCGRRSMTHPPFTSISGMHSPSVDSFSQSYTMRDMERVPDPVDELTAAWQAELPDVLGPETELVKRVILLARTLGDAVAAELPSLGLTPAEFDVLAALRRTGEPYARRPNDLTRALLLSSGGISNVVNRLAAR